MTEADAAAIPEPRPLGAKRRLWRFRRTWYRRIKPAWRAYRPVAILLLTVLVLVLGTIGNHKAHPDYTFWDRLYNSLQLFGLGGPTETAPPWQLEVARFLGPLLVGYAAIRGLLVLFREQMQLFWFRLTLRDHIVIVGLGDVGFNLAGRFNRAGLRLVVIESDPTQARISACRDRGIGVLIGSGSDSIMLDRARTGQAAYAIVSCGHDQVDIEVAMAIRDRPRQWRRRTLTVFAHLGDPMLWRTIKAQALHASSRHKLRLEPFNLLDSAASLMVEEAAATESGDAPSRVLISAQGGIIQSLTLHVLRVAHNSDTAQQPRIEMFGEAAAAELRSLLSRHPELEGISEIEATDLDPESPVAAETIAGCSAIYVADPNEARGLATALAMRAATADRTIPVTLAVGDQHGGVGVAAAAAGIRVFGILSNALGDEFLDRGMNEVMARAKHDLYVAAQEATGETTRENPSLVPWEQLDPALRQSNRLFVDAIGDKLDQIGCVAIPDPLVASSDGRPFSFLPEEIEALAQSEHIRWMRDLTDEGWKHSPAGKDPVRRQHPSLVPWAELSAAEQQKDRDAVVAIPAILTRGGYRIVRALPSPAGSEPAAVTG